MQSLCIVSQVAFCAYLYIDVTVQQAGNLFGETWDYEAVKNNLTKYCENANRLTYSVCQTMLVAMTLKEIFPKI